MKFFSLSTALMLGLVRAVDATSCPCFTAEDTKGDVHRFVDGAYTDNPSHTSTTYQLYTTDRRRYVTRDATTRYLDRGRQVELQAYTCIDENVREDYSLIVDPNRDFRTINKQQYFACRDTIRNAAQFYTPTDANQKQQVEDTFASRPLTLQNVGTQKLLTRQSDGSIDTVVGIQQLSTESTNQWTLERDECPRLESSAAKHTERACFRLQSYPHPEDTILSTNGFVALREAPPAHILGVYILEPTLCFRNLDSCFVRLSVAYYGDRSVADLTAEGPYATPLRLAVGSEQELDEAEWIISLV